MEAAAKETLPVSEAIRRARIESGLTQGQLAARLEVSQTTVSFWESGTEAPRIHNLIALAGELPEILDSLGERELGLLRRAVQLERRLFAGRCGCPGCSCQPTSDE